MRQRRSQALFRWVHRRRWVLSSAAALIFFVGVGLIVGKDSPAKGLAVGATTGAIAAIALLALGETTEQGRISRQARRRRIQSRRQSASD